MSVNSVGINIFANEPPDPRAGTGAVFWVGATATTQGGVAGVDNAGSFGSSPQRPFATIDYAITQCADSRGDVIYLLPQHQENIIDGTTFQLDKIGVTVVGLGRGTDRPQFNVTVDGAIEMDAANCRIENIMLIADITAVTVGVNVDAAYCEIVNCEFNFNLAGTDDFLIMVDVDNVDHCVIDHCRFIAEPAVAGSNTAIRLDEADWIRITNNIFTGDYAVAAINGVAAASLQGLIAHNYIYNDDTGAAENAIDLDVASTGLIAYNTIGSGHTTTVADLIDPGSMRQIENYGNNDVNTYAIVIGAGADA